jgi:PTS system mannose-specific IIA component
MINIVVVAHGELGEVLVRTVEMIAGPCEGLTSVSLLPQDSPEHLASQVRAVLHGIEGQETLILVDLFGGTPFNVVAREVRAPNVECVTGVNLPMLLEAVTSREGVTLAQLKTTVLRAGRDSVRDLGAALRA